MRELLNVDTQLSNSYKNVAAHRLSLLYDDCGIGLLGGTQIKTLPQVRWPNCYHGVHHLGGSYYFGKNQVQDHLGPPKDQVVYIPIKDF